MEINLEDEGLARSLEVLEGQPYRIVRYFDPYSNPTFAAIAPPNSGVQGLYATILKEMEGLERSVGCAEVRDPVQNAYLFGDGGSDRSAMLWHRDSRDISAAGDVGSAVRIVYLWATVKSTEIWVVGEAEPRPPIPPCFIVALDNHKCLHRPPRNFGPDRWFARATPSLRIYPIDPAILEAEKAIPDQEKLTKKYVQRLDWNWQPK